VNYHKKNIKSGVMDKLVGFFSELSSCGQNGWCFFNKITINNFNVLFLLNQVKRKQALQGSNLSGISLTTDKNVNKRGLLQDSFLIFLEVFMPLKIHQ